MRLIAPVLALNLPTWAFFELRWPDTKYDMGTCVTPKNTTSSWYGKTGYIKDIVYGKFLEVFAYKITIRGLDRMQFYDLFAIPSIDVNTAQVMPCQS